MFRKNIKIDLDLSQRPAPARHSPPWRDDGGRLCGEKSGFPRGARNSGVALIMVLGLLTVMVILAVTFAISMRTERLAAGNYADNVRARELVHVGLARAMNDLATNLLGTNGLSGLNGKVYPTWNVTNSYTNINGSGAARWVTTNNLVRGEATNYIPRALWADATNADFINSSNHWLPVESLIYTNGYLAESNLMGRVAYLIINCSGLIDANYAGGAARMGGTNPNEIALGYLGETNANFNLDRQTDVRYETMGELNALAGINKPATNLFVYSRAPSGYWNTNSVCVETQLVNLSGSAADLISRQSEIKNAFTNSGFSVYESDVLFSNLLDYVDSDSVPTNLDYCVESVPMINEVLVECNISIASASGMNTYTLAGNVQIECWYPFLNAPDPLLSFRLNATAQFLDQSIPIVFGVLPASTFPVYNIPAPISPGMIIPIPPQSFGPFVSGPLAPNPIAIRSIIAVSITEFPSGTIVDQLLVPVVITNFHDGVTPSNTYADIECLDPRFNSNTADPNQWKYMGNTNNNSIGFSNTWTKSFLSSANDGGCAMFVSNGPLRSVAELSYLVYSQYEPWKTVKLVGYGMKRVLDYFAIGTNNTDVYVTQAQDVRRGLVNPNSMQVDALAAVFADMPIGEYPGDYSLGQLNMASARVVAENLYTNRYYTNLSEVGRAFENITQLTNTSAMPGVITFDNKQKRDSLFRNACGLLSVRQNVFTIIIEAQAASGGNIPRNPAKQRAVAIVWRDPYTGEMFVRHIKWLGD